MFLKTTTIMKKNLMLALTFIVMYAGSLFGQAPSPSDIYIIGTSRTSSAKFTGFDKGSPTIFNHSLHNYAPIYFKIRSIEKDYEIWLQHYNYKLAALKKIRPTGPDDSCVFYNMPLSKLSSLNAIYVEDFINTHTQAQAWAWMKANQNKRVWVIDRNDFYKSSPAFPSNNMMKLTQVYISLFNLPDAVRNGPDVVDYGSVSFH